MLNIKMIYGQLLYALAQIAGVDNAKKFDTGFRFKRKLDLKNPKTLADKVSYIELHCQSPLAPECTDKYAVREYVAKKGLEHILIPLAGGPWSRAEDVDFSSLPDKFALKATHGCKMNYLVPDKAKMNIADCKVQMQRWMNTTYGTYSMEPHYRTIPHRIYAEQFLESADDLIDYKFHCFNGEPQFVLVCSDRKADGDAAMQVTLDLFDMNWSPIFEIQAKGGEVPGTGKIVKPILFEQMVQVARKLSEEFQFVRVDLYEHNGNVMFGELTFSPACCVFPYFTDEFNVKMGELLRIE